MFYAVNSLIGFTPVWGLVSIKNSKFNRLNACGAVVKSYYEDVGKPNVLGSVNYVYLTD